MMKSLKPDNIRNACRRELTVAHLPQLMAFGATNQITMQ